MTLQEGVRNLASLKPKAAKALSKFHGATISNVEVVRVDGELALCRWRESEFWLKSTDLEEITTEPVKRKPKELLP